MSQIKERRENTPANLHGTGFLHYPSPVGMPVPETLGTRCKSSCHVLSVAISFFVEEKNTALCIVAIDQIFFISKLSGRKQMYSVVIHTVHAYFSYLLHFNIRCGHSIWFIR